MAIVLPLSAKNIQRSRENTVDKLENDWYTNRAKQRRLNRIRLTSRQWQRGQQRMLPDRLSGGLFVRGCQCGIRVL
jgi:hypothetical protein